MSAEHMDKIKMIVVIGLMLEPFAVKSLNINGAATQARTGQTSTPQNAKPFNQKQALDELRKQIAGKENKPAEEVFQNIQFFKRLPAGRLLGAMEFIYSKSLGVDCTHCHVVDQWEKDDKPTKQIAREMQKMTFDIMEDLKKIKGLKSENPVVNCATCHRGQTKPTQTIP